MSTNRPHFSDSGKHQVEAMDLERLATTCETIEGIEKSELSIGDRLVVTTTNSVYTFNYLGDGRFSASGGWFDKRDLSPAIVRICGCSFGGSAINRRLAAAPGLHIEFDNGVVTTPIRRLSLWRMPESSEPN